MIQIETEADYEIFKTKYGISSLTEGDDIVLKLWLVGNEVLKFKENTSYYHFLIGLGSAGSADKYRNFKLIKYDGNVARIVDENIFKCKNITLTENFDLFDKLFIYFSK